MRSPIARAFAVFARAPRRQQCSGTSTPTASFFSDAGSSLANPSNMSFIGRWYSPASLWKGVSPRSIAMVCATAAIAVRTDPTRTCFPRPRLPCRTIPPKLVMWCMRSLKGVPTMYGSAPQGCKNKHQLTKCLLLFLVVSSTLPLSIPWSAVHL